MTVFKFSKSVGAMQGLAYGDALGWCFERPYKSTVFPPDENKNEDKFSCRKWIRKSGSFYMPFNETIQPGEYSDDTQLAIAVARSLGKGKNWFDYFTKVELPFWTLYQRGAGGATNRAINSWMQGLPPWSEQRFPQDVKKYFDAGGNGVAMRIMPHVLWHSSDDFDKLASNILRNAMATHGHPRAIVGALAYAYGAWHANHVGSVKYNEILEALRDNKDTWGKFPDMSEYARDGEIWMKQAQKYSNDYAKIWSDAVNESMSYFDKAYHATKKMVEPTNFLKELDCFNKQNSGSGIVACAVSTFMAGWYAGDPDPQRGIYAVASANGSDTDTNASMTAALIGCMNNDTAWIKSIQTEIQDRNYLEKLGLALPLQKLHENLDYVPLNQQDCVEFLDKFLPVQMPVTMNVSDDCVTKASYLPEQTYSGYKVRSVKLLTTDDQTMYMSRTIRGNFSPK